MTDTMESRTGGLKRRSVLRGAAWVGAGVAAEGPRRAYAAVDKMRIISSQKGLWDTTLVAFGSDKGIFKDQGIELDIQWSDGGVDALQAVIAGSLEFAVAPGILGALSAFVRHVPLVVTNAEMTGSSDLFWYVRADSPIKSMKDAAGKTVAFSRPGSSSELVAGALTAAAGVKSKLVSTGGLGATLTQVMSGQVDVGWSAPPVALKEVQEGKARIIAYGNDAPELAGQTVRVGVTSARFLEAKPEVLRRFIQGMQKTIDWGYSGDEALQMYATLHHIDLETARLARDKGYPKAALALAPVGDLDLSIKQGVADRQLSRPLTPDEMKEFVRHVAEFTSPA